MMLFEVFAHIFNYITLQGNVWTEYLPTYQLVEYMAYPRASAVAEIGWSQPENRNWKDYLKRLQIQFERWRYYQVILSPFKLICLLLPHWATANKSVFHNIQSENTCP